MRSSASSPPSNVNCAPCGRTRQDNRRPPKDLLTQPRSSHADVVARAVALVDRAEYKRRQAPPGVKLRPKAFGRDRRIPITNRWPG